MTFSLNGALTPPASTIQPVSAWLPGASEPTLNVAVAPEIDGVNVAATPSSFS